MSFVRCCFGVLLSIACLPMAARADFEQAMTLYRMQKYELAAAEFARLVEADPKYADGHFLVGLCHYQLGRAEDAVAHLQRAVDLNGKRFNYRNALASAYLVRQDGRQALFALTGCDALVQSDPERFELHRTRGLALVQLGQYVDGARDIEAAMRFKSSPELELQLGVCRLGEGDNDRAIGVLEPVAKAAPGNGEPALYLAQAYLARAQKRPANRISDYRLAVAHALRAVELGRNDVDALMLLGQVQMGAGELVAASKSFQTVLTHEPARCTARVNLGKCQLAAGHVEKAVQTLDKARGCAPNDVGVLEALGYARLQLGQLEQAAQLYDEALAVRPSDNLRAGREIVRARVERRKLDAMDQNEQQRAEEEYRARLLEYEQEQNRRDAWRKGDRP